MSIEDFLLLLQLTEGSTIDFKASAYDLTDKSKQIDFVKDILCMVNTPRQGSSYIVLGVKKYDDGNYDLRGLSSTLDDADLQTIVANQISPVPKFLYEVLLHNGKSFGLITIPEQKGGPFFPTCNFDEKKIGILKKGKIYFRRGSKNDEALPAEIARIYTWMEEIPLSPLTNIDAWEDFLNSVNNFDPSYKIILLSSPIDATIRNLSAIGKLPLSMTLDFDSQSDKSGLLSKSRENLEARRSLHQIVIGDRPSINPDRATNWFFARGLEGRDKTLKLGPYVEWGKVYNREIFTQFELFAKSINPSPVLCLVLWTDTSLNRHLQSVLDSAMGAFGESLHIVIVSESIGELESLATEVGADQINLPLNEFCSGIDLAFSDETNSENDCVLPSSSGAPIIIERKDYLWLSEDLEIVHKNVGIAPPLDRNIGEDFLRGSEITWYELASHWDIDRDKSSRLERAIRTDLEKKRTVRINLYHAPGAGGTTLARHILWKLHNEYICCVLVNCTPQATAERLYRIASMTGRGIVLLVDGSQIEERQIDDLFTLLRSRQIPVVIFQTLRRFNRQEERDRAFYLEAKLSASESWRIIDKLTIFKPGKRSELEALLKSPSERLKTPFYFGLQTFEEDFLGLAPFISTKLADLNPLQQKILCYLSIAHHYAQRPIRSQAFAQILGIPKNKSVKILNAIAESCHDLIVESYDESWRTAHDLIATEILRQVLSGTARDKRIWNQYLSTWAKNFAEFCRGGDEIVSDEMLEMARRTFIYRDNTDVLGSERSDSRDFAQILDDIPSPEGRLEVLKKLVDLFPEEAHFWSHLGRYYSIQRQDFPEALTCAEKAIKLDPLDNVLYHMQGMIFRNEINVEIEQNSDISEIVETVKNASTAFEKSRELAPDDEHGYISEVQMLTKVLDFAGRKHPNGALGYLSLPSADPFLRESLQKAEDLLEQVRRSREGEGPSTYESTARAKLSTLYGRYPNALQLWNNLLSRRDTYHPPLRRQIVWTYLAKHQRSWKRLTQNEITKSIELLNENIDEDPSNEKDLRLWIQAVRHSNNPPSLETVIERLSYWRSNSNSIDSVFYLYVFHSLLAMKGSAISRDDAERFMEECRQMARFRRNRTKSFEWLGKESGIKKLIHQSELGEWDNSTDFWEKSGQLGRIRGRIEKIDGPQAGKIAVEGGLTAFFVPSRSNHSVSKSENLPVDFYLGFSYDGLRAWEVQNTNL